MELLGTFLAGLGLYFAGVKGIGQHFRQLTSHRFRQVLAQAVKNPLRAGSVGILSGALTQSSVAIMFITMSMVTSGVVDVRRSFPMVTWAFVGSSALVMLATVNIHIFILYLLGAVGICYYLNLDEHERYRHLVGSLLGIGILFLGLWMVKSATLPLQDEQWVAELLSISASSLVMMLAIGAVFGFVAQSSATVSVIAIALGSVGLLNLDQTLFIVLGSNLGAGYSVYFLARTMRGSSRQIVLLHLWLKLISVAICIPLILIDTYTDLPGLQTALLLTGLDHTTVIGLFYLLLQLVSALVYAFFDKTLASLAARAAPPEPKDELSKPAYIFEQALEEPEAAISLLEKELERLLVRLPNYFDSLRPDERSEHFFPATELHPASQKVIAESTRYTNTLMSNAQSSATLERLLNVHARTELVRHLQDGCFEIERALQAPFSEPFAQQLSQQIVEGLHAVVSVLCETVVDQDQPDILLMMSGDRSTLMERIRAGMLGNRAEFSDESRGRLFAVTTIFERVIWLIHRYAQILAKTSSQQEGGLPSPISRTS